VVRENLEPPVINQPAGHLEEDESLLDAVKREVLEETAHVFQPVTLVGIYRWISSTRQTYMRFCFAGEVIEKTSLQLDPDILEVQWLGLEDLHNERLRSPLVLKCIEDFQRGQSYDLSILNELV
jgi:8-oxo-dGTP pyrophosphatase MutT (NUDIX family)